MHPKRERPRAGRSSPEKRQGKSVDVVTGQVCARDGGGVCLWCKHPFEGYVYRAVVNVYHEPGGTSMCACYGSFCSSACLLADIMEDAKLLYHYRNVHYADCAHLVSHTKAKIKEDLGIDVDTSRRAKHWSTIRPFAYGTCDIDSFRKESALGR